MTKNSKRRTCFISAPVGTDLTDLTGVLEKHGYDVIAPTSFAPGQLWLDTLQEQLLTVSLVIGVLNSEKGIANAAFEIGFALGTGKPVLVIAPQDVSDLPFAVSSLFLIRAEPTNRAAIDFALEQIQNAPPRRTSRPKPLQVGPILGDYVDNYVARLRTANTEVEIISLLKDMLVASRVDVISEARVGKGRADLAVWSDALEPYVGNPLILEVKRELQNLKDVRRALAQVTDYVDAAGTLWGFLLYVHGPDKNIVEAEASASRVLVISVDELLERLRTVSFFDVVRSLRNSKVHGVEG